MPFIAACTYCRGKVRVPDSTIGQSLNCPRCRTCFTLAPLSEGHHTPTPVPGTLKTDVAPLIAAALLRRAALPHPLPPMSAPPARVSAIPADPVRAASCQAGTVALPGREPSVSPPSRFPPVVSGREPFPSDSQSVTAGLAALFLGSTGLLCASLPFVQVLTIPLSGLGVLIGVGGLWLGEGPKHLVGLQTIGPAVSLFTLFAAGAGCLS